MTPSDRKRGAWDLVPDDPGPPNLAPGS
jgi:hypothetical protein